MKAVQMTAIGGPEVLQVVEVPESQPAPGFVPIRNLTRVDSDHLPPALGSLE